MTEESFLSNYEPVNLSINHSHEASQSVEECMNQPVLDYTESGDQSVLLCAEVTLNTMNET
jgi:hypothetical protein